MRPRPSPAGNNKKEDRYMPGNDKFLYLEPVDGGYVSDLSRLFGEECRMGATKDGVAVLRGDTILAEADLDEEDRVVQVAVGGSLGGLSKAQFQDKIRPFLGAKVLYRGPV